MAKSSSIDRNDLMFFEICGRQYKLTEYDDAIKENEESLANYYSFLQEFPYTIRKLSRESLASIKDAPVFLLYRNKRISVYEFLISSRLFESQLSLIKEINGLEIKYGLANKLIDIQQKKENYAIKIETYRVFQDLHYTMATARWALIQAHRILHFSSSLKWITGWEQLWTRATWLNNAILLYNSCFDKLILSIWIGCKVFVGYLKKNSKPEKALNIQNLNSQEGLNLVYEWCDYNKIKNRLPEKIKNDINLKYTNELKRVRNYANRIKHRGGMRYKDLFPYDNTYDIIEDTFYASTRTQISDDIDDIVEEVKNYHIVLYDLIQKVYEYIIGEVFDQEIHE